jgi:hypothetical protein
MSFRNSARAVALLLGLFLLVVAGLGYAGGSKQLVLVFTTDTSGELNPCG